MNPITTARHRKVASVIKQSNDYRWPSNTLYVGLGASCQEPFGTSFQVIRNTNANHYLPFGDDKPQPLG